MSEVMNTGQHCSICLAECTYSPHFSYTCPAHGFIRIMPARRVPFIQRLREQANKKEAQNEPR